MAAVANKVRVVVAKCRVSVLSLNTNLRCVLVTRNSCVRG